MPTISVQLNGFLKGLLLVVVFAVIDGAAQYLGDVSHLVDLLGPFLGPILAPAIGTAVTGWASMIESDIKDKYGAGLFGAVRVVSTGR